MGTPGGANNAYFHVVANGRRCKCNIWSLTTEVGIILEPTLIQEHIYAFYRELLSASTPRGCGLVPNTWGVSRLVSMEENYQLYLTFIEAELEAIVKDMKPDTAKLDRSAA